MAFFNQIKRILHVISLPLRLPIRTYISWIPGTFVRCNTEPFEGFPNIFLSTCHEASLIGIFYSKQEFTLILFLQKGNYKGPFGLLRYVKAL